MKKIAFLDRDGTINKDYPDKEWKNIKKPELLIGTIEGLQLIKKYGYEIIIITNQYIIADGIITEKQYIDFNTELTKILNENRINVLKIYYCPHNDLENCNCKKPKTGMIDMAQKDFGIDFDMSFYVGDSYCDYELAQKLNLDFYGIKGKNDDNVFKFNNLIDVAKELEAYTK